MNKFVLSSILFCTGTICLICIVPVSGAESPYIEWEKTYGGITKNQGFSIIQTNDGGYLIAGQTRYYGEDAYLVKITSTGELEWDREYGDTNEDGALHVAQTSDGGYIFVGWAANSSLDMDSLIVKVDDKGKVEWQKKYRQPYEFRHITELEDGGYVLAGSETHQKRDISLMGIDNSGNYIWKKTFGGFKSDTGRNVQVLPDGGLILFCSYQIDDNERLLNKFDFVPYLVKTDRFGNKIWNRFIDGFTISDSMVITDEGNCIIATGKRSGEGENRNIDVYLVEVDDSGDIVRELDILHDINGTIISFDQTTDGGFILCGDINTESETGVDVLLVRTDKDGKVLWEKTIGGERGDVGYSVIQSRDGGFVLTGLNYSSSNYAGDVYVVKVAPEGQQPPKEPDIPQTTQSPLIYAPLAIPVWYLLLRRHGQEK